MGKRILYDRPRQHATSVTDVKHDRHVGACAVKGAALRPKRRVNADLRGHSQYSYENEDQDAIMVRMGDGIYQR